MLKVLKNWLMEHSNRIFEGSSGSRGEQAFQTISFENKMEYRKALSSSASQLRPSSKLLETRPQSSKFSTLNF